MSPNPVIHIEKLCLSLKGPSGDVSILKNVNLQINAGERVSVVGPSGSGKTSLLLIIAGLERATSGLVEVNGNTMMALSEDELAIFRRAHVGIVFQNFHLIPSMTALENVALPLEFAGKAEAFAQAHEALVSVGLAHRIHHFPAQLSGGEQQRVALARAFAIRPAILLADEPTGNLDQENGKQIMELMFALHKERGTTLMLITHDIELARHCDRTITLRDGQIAE